MIKHLRDNNQTYFEHLKDAWMYAIYSLACSYVYFIHGALPMILQHNGSRMTTFVYNHILNKDNSQVPTVCIQDISDVV